MTKRNPKDNGVQIPFMEPEFMDKWQEWLQYRKERRLPNYVATGLKHTFTKLVNDSQNDYKIAIQIIDQSLSQGWQGLFPIKALSNGATTLPVNTGSNQKPTGTSRNRIESLKNF